jgi:hypothetical protein
VTCPDCRIEELIRQKNIEENYTSVMDEHPEVEIRGAGWGNLLRKPARNFDTARSWVPLLPSVLQVPLSDVL